MNNKKTRLAFAFSSSLLIAGLLVGVLLISQPEPLHQPSQAIGRPTPDADDNCPSGFHPETVPGTTVVNCIRDVAGSNRSPGPMFGHSGRASGGAICQNNDDCPLEEFCDASLTVKRCIPRKDNGGSCTDETQCASAFCYQGRCSSADSPHNPLHNLAGRGYYCDGDHGDRICPVGYHCNLNAKPWPRCEPEAGINQQSQHPTPSNLPHQARLQPTPTLTPANRQPTTTPTPSTTNPPPIETYTFSYKLDSQDWSRWSQNTTILLKNLSNGHHTFKVRAKDAAGNIDPSPAQRTFAVQTAETTPSPTPSPTPTPTPPATPTPSTTPLPGQALLTFRVGLEGRSSDKNAAAIRLVARNKNFQQNEQTNPRGAKTGHLIELPLDKFGVGQSVTFLAKTCGYLQARRDVLLQSGENSIDFGTLRAGDILGNDAFGGDIGDNEVNVLDYSKLISLFEGNDACADFNGDGLVEVLDYSLMLNNFDVAGEVMEK